MLIFALLAAVHCQQNLTVLIMTSNHEEYSEINNFNSGNYYPWPGLLTQ